MKTQLLKPIKSEKDYEAAVQRIAKLTHARKGSEERKELDVLYILVEHYEDRHHRIEPPQPAEAIKFRIEQGRVKESTLVSIFGSSAKLKAVLQGRRSLGPQEIVQLQAKLGIPLESLL